MNIKIITELVQLEIADTPTIGSDNYIKRSVPPLDKALEDIINQVIKLHKELSKKAIDHE